MKLRSLTVAFILIGGLLRVQSAVSSNLDHLIPVDLTQHRNYREVLVSKLGITPFNCARAMLLPPFDPEVSTSVYWVPKNGQRIYYVTWISAKENLWERIDGGRYPARAKTVKIDRLDAEIPHRTAEMIKEVWIRMLQAPHGARPLPPAPELITVDSTDAEFSVERPNAAPLYARLDFSRSFPGKKTKRLVDIWNALYEYCKAPAEKRSKIASQIEQQAKQLLAQLK